MPETIKSETILKGKIITVKIDDVLIENGKTVKREIVEHAKAACIFAYDDTCGYLVEQYRHPMKAYLLEAVAGLCQTGENPADTAVRELNEEADALCQPPEFLGEFYSSPGFCNEIIYLYAAKITGFQKGTPDDDEFVQLKKYPFKDLYQMLDNGEIKDGKTETVLLKFRTRHPEIK